MSFHARSSEQDRLASLDRYDILDTPEEESFDRITRLTRRVLGISMSTINLIDGHRQWFKSRQGILATEGPRGPALCDYVIRESRPLIVPDTLADQRFAQNPYVLGAPYIRFYAGVPLRTPDNHNIGTLCAMDTSPRQFGADQVEILSDLARIVMSELELRAIATTDVLTGALSRRAFKEEADRAIALALRYGHPLSCLVLDFDHFRAVNESHGHSGGDLVLSKSIATCRSTLRRSDLLGRVGGEEFAILLPHTGRAAAMEVAEKLRSAIAHQCIAVPSGTLQVSASIGIATLDRLAGQIETLLQRADEALYVAKADGRNRCSEWQPPAAAAPQPGLRRRVLKAGQISFNGGGSTIDCTVRSLSETGAGLDVSSSADVPEQFKLRIDSDAISKFSRIVTKRDKHIEVEFQ